LANGPLWTRIRPPFDKKWDELIGWEKRAEGEGRFFVDKLRDYGAKKVLNVAPGTVFHSVRLIKAGFDVTSAEMLTRAFRKARERDRIHLESLGFPEFYREATRRFGLKKNGFEDLSAQLAPAAGGYSRKPNSGRRSYPAS
jgi:hypothetical protein